VVGAWAGEDVEGGDALVEHPGGAGGGGPCWEAYGYGRATLGQGRMTGDGGQGRRPVTHPQEPWGVGPGTPNRVTDRGSNHGLAGPATECLLGDRGATCGAPLGVWMRRGRSRTTAASRK